MVVAVVVLTRISFDVVVVVIAGVGAVSGSLETLSVGCEVSKVLLVVIMFSIIVVGSFRSAIVDARVVVSSECVDFVLTSLLVAYETVDEVSELSVVVSSET